MNPWLFQSPCDPYEGETEVSDREAVTNGGDFPRCAPSVPPSSAVQGSVRTEGPTGADGGSDRHVVDWEAERLRKLVAMKAAARAYRLAADMIEEEQA